MPVSFTFLKISSAPRSVQVVFGAGHPSGSDALLCLGNRALKQELPKDKGLDTQKGSSDFRHLFSLNCVLFKSYSITMEKIYS